MTADVMTAEDARALVQEQAARHKAEEKEVLVALLFSRLIKSPKSTAL